MYARYYVVGVSTGKDPFLRGGNKEKDSEADTEIEL